MKKLSIVVPVYNEIDTLEEILQRIKAVELDMEKEIILVDDYSTDGTRKLLEQIKEQGNENEKVFFHEKNMGKGAALKTGFQHVTGDITLVQDADLEYNPNEYPKLVAPILEGKADAVYGSRFMIKPDGMANSLHYSGNRMLTWFSNIFTGLNLTDMETCYKVIKTEILKEIEIKNDRFGVEPEITAKLARRKCKVSEVPISYSRRAYSEGKKITWKDGVSAIYQVIRFRFLN